MITRENIKQYLLQIKQQEGDETISNRWQPDILVEIIYQIYDYHEAQMKDIKAQLKAKSDIIINLEINIKEKDDIIKRLGNKKN